MYCISTSNSKLDHLLESSKLEFSEEIKILDFQMYTYTHLIWSPRVKCMNLLSIIFSDVSWSFVSWNSFRIFCISDSYCSFSASFACCRPIRRSFKSAISSAKRNVKRVVIRCLDKLTHGRKFKISKFLTFWNFNLKTCNIPAKYWQFQV